MLRQHRTRLALWVVPALLFRALIPIGFMLDPIDGRAEIVLCGSDAPIAGEQHRGGDNAGHHHHSHVDPTCPYAQSAGAAPLPAWPVLAAAPAPGIASAAGEQQIHAHFGPTRRHSPRGPPRLA